MDSRNISKFGQGYYLHLEINFYFLGKFFSSLSRGGRPDLNTRECFKGGIKPECAAQAEIRGTQFIAI